MFQYSNVQMFKRSNVQMSNVNKVKLLLECTYGVFSVIFGVLKNQPAIQGKLRKHYLCKQSVSLGWVMSLGHSPIQRDKLTNTQVAKTLFYKTRFSWTCRKAGDSDHREQAGSRVCCKRRGCSGSPPP